MSGAGKSQALHCLEDLGFFCIDNLPVGMLSKLAELCAESGGRLSRVALGIDIREGIFLNEFFIALDDLEERGGDHRILFLDADDRTLIRRFSESRRRHPLGKRVGEGIHEERRRLREIKAAADQIIDTSALTPGELKDRLSSL
ncbi:MAG: RNase adaptor protein RapZ, partial [Elusimicrobia bacterium]|nr:RNase adaptor protein RapZ [Elusimicrobiota bacterium]